MTGGDSNNVVSKLLLFNIDRIIDYIVRNLADHNDSKWASQFRQHGITAAALSTSKVKQSKIHLNLRNPKFM